MYNQNAIITIVIEKHISQQYINTVVSSPFTRKNSMLWGGSVAEK